MLMEMQLIKKCEKKEKEGKEKCPLFLLLFNF